MKLTIDSQRLYKKCQAAAKTLPSKAMLPAYAWFLIEADAFSGITITACGEGERCTYLVEDVELTGDAASFCIDARQLIGILGELPQQPITIEINSSHTAATVRWGGGNGKAELPIYDVAEYLTADFKYNHAIELPVSILSDVAQCVQFVVADDELRPVMSGTLYDFREGNLVVVGSDGQALVRMTAGGVGEPDYMGGDERKTSVIVPRRAYAMLDMFVKEAQRSGKKTVRMEWGAANACFSTSDATVMTRLAEGNYPNYNSVIPVSNPFNAIVDRLSLIAALRRTMVFAQKSTMRVHMRFEEGKLTIEGSDMDFSTSSSEHLPAQLGGMDRFVVAVNASKLLDVLTHISTEEVLIEGSEPSRALLFTGVNDERMLLMLLMPMMLNEV